MPDALGARCGMTLDPGVANLELARALADQLATSGVHHAVICPGSRSTPIAVSLASQPDIQTWVLSTSERRRSSRLVWRGSSTRRFRPQHLRHRRGQFSRPLSRRD